MDYTRWNGIWSAESSSGTYDAMRDIMNFVINDGGRERRVRRRTVADDDREELYRRYLHDMLFNTMGVNASAMGVVTIAEEDVDQTAFEQILNKEFVYE